MTQLTVDYSEALVELIEANRASIDGVEVGPWFSPDQVRKFRKLLPDVPFYYHASSVVARLRVGWKTLVRIQEYLDCTHSPWLSLHIELLPWHVFLLSNHAGLHLPPPEPKQAVRQFIEAIDRIKKVVDIPILLENLASLPLEKYNFAASPEHITEIVRKSESGFLLDIAHARIAASFQGEDVHAYIEKLPLEKTEQIHVSGVRLRKGHLFDAHEMLEETDYQLLKWILGRCNPKVITLEYFREKNVLREQLIRLGGIVAG